MKSNHTASDQESVMARHLVHLSQSRCLDAYCLNSLLLGLDNAEENLPAEKYCLDADMGSVERHN